MQREKLHPPPQHEFLLQRKVAGIIHRQLLSVTLISFPQKSRDRLNAPSGAASSDTGTEPFFSRCSSGLSIWSKKGTSTNLYFLSAHLADRGKWKSQCEAPPRMVCLRESVMWELNSSTKALSRPHDRISQFLQTRFPVQLGIATAGNIKSQLRLILRQDIHREPAVSSTTQVSASRFSAGIRPRFTAVHTHWGT
jgi:hypothetical protein